MKFLVITSLLFITQFAFSAETINTAEELDAVSPDLQQLLENAEYPTTNKQVFIPKTEENTDKADPKKLTLKKGEVIKTINDQPVDSPAKAMELYNELETTTEQNDEEKSLSILGVHHVQITAPKDRENEARHFYCEVLGLKEIEKPENRRKNGGFWLLAGNTEIHVGLEDGIERAKSKAHVAYSVNNLESWKKRLLDKNIEVFETPPLPNAKSFEFRDPFGNRIEIIQVI